MGAVHRQANRPRGLRSVRQDSRTVPGCLISNLSARSLLALYSCAQLSRGSIVKPARLHFARTARALTGRYIHVCERGDLSEFLAARHAGLTRGSIKDAARDGGRAMRAAHGNS